MAKFDLDTIRHSGAHLMAQAIERSFPQTGVQFGVGPVVENGFYYDVQSEHKFTEEDLLTIETKMKEIIKENLPIERRVLEKDVAVKFFQEKKQNLKVELISGFPVGEEISCYAQGEFIDLCRGPHVEKTGEIPPFFKLTKVAGAYWKGDEEREVLQRIYAVAFSSKDQLKEYLHFLEEAKKRDHRKLGRELDLILFDQKSPGAPFFLPHGAFVYNELINFIRRIYVKFDYKEVITPQILDSELWHISGHYENYKENMYFTQIEEREFAVKPMNCPCHMLMYAHQKFSYRDLPLRYADFGRLHRFERSGTLAGLTRVRSFCQDDAHIFLAVASIQKEISSLLSMFSICYKHFGFKEMKIFLSTRPEKKVGSDETWDIAEAALTDALNASGMEYNVLKGEGAFYGPKIDVQINDALKRGHQLGTIQLDFQLPERFDLTFTNSEGKDERPVVIHRALLGSLERFFGVYLEHVAGAFPFWLAPVQAVIVPVKNDLHLEYCQKLQEKLVSHGYRVKVDDRNESMGFKTRQIQTRKVPYMLVIGDKEMETGDVNVRKYGEKQSLTLSEGDLFGIFQELSLENMPKELS